jgi:hypothetical protein
VTAFNVFAYRHHAPESDTRKEELPHWNLHRLEAWIIKNRFDVVLIERSDTPARGRPEVTHHICDDPVCPGGC